MVIFKRSRLEKLVGALLLDRAFRESFLTSDPVGRITAIENYNQSYARRYGENLVQLSLEEKQLVGSLGADTLTQFCQQLELTLEETAKFPSQQLAVLIEHEKAA